MGFDPLSVTLEAAVFSTLVGAGAEVGGATIAATYAITAGIEIGALVGLNILLTPKIPGANAPDPGRQKEIFTGEESAIIHIIGRAQVGGKKIFGNSVDVIKLRLYAVAQGPMDGVETYLVGGNEVTVDGSGIVVTPPWSFADGGPFLYIKTKVGNDTELAWDDLLAHFSTMWTPAHRGRGVAQVLAQYGNPGFDSPIYLRLYQSGVPDIVTQWRGELVYNPATNTTAWSDNGILVILHVMRLLFNELSLDVFDLDQIETEAAKADALVLRNGGGSTKRSRLWGFWSEDQDRQSILQPLLDSAGVIIVPRENGAKIGLQLLDDIPESEFSIAQKDIIDLQWRAGPEGVDRPNVCVLKWYSPGEGYQLKEITLGAWSRIDDEIDRVGEKVLTVNLPNCPDAGQAQRIARQKFLLARADTGTVMTNLVAKALWGCRFVTIDLGEIGEKLCYVGVPKTNPADPTQPFELPFLIWPDFTDWDPDVDESPTPDPLPTNTYADPLTAPDQQTQACVVIYPDGSRHTRVDIPSTGGVPNIEIAYSAFLGTDRPAPWLPMTRYTSPSPIFYPHGYAAVDLTGQLTRFRVRSFDANGEHGSDWSTVFETTCAVDNTAPSVPTVIDDTVQVRAPTSLNVAAVALYSGATQIDIKPVKPGEVVGLTPSGIGPFTVKALSSNGTPSTAVAVP